MSIWLNTSPQQALGCLLKDCFYSMIFGFIVLQLESILLQSQCPLDYVLVQKVLFLVYGWTS